MRSDYLFWGLAFMCLYLFWRIGKQILATYRCLEEWEIRDFLTGRSKKNEDQHRRVITHLGHCEKCQDKLHRIQKGLPIEDHLVDGRGGE